MSRAVDCLFAVVQMTPLLAGPFVLFGSLGTVLAAAEYVDAVNAWTPRVLTGSDWADALLFVLTWDLVGYWSHRLSHAVPALWWLHKWHHSGTVMWPVLLYRIHPAEIVQNLLWKAPLVALLGVPVWWAVAWTAWELWAHSGLPGNWSLGGVLVTPQYHRVHHSVLEHHHGKNYGALLQVWDWLFDTRCDAVGDFPVGLHSAD